MSSESFIHVKMGLKTGTTVSNEDRNLVLVAVFLVIKGTCSPDAGHHITNGCRKQKCTSHVVRKCDVLESSIRFHSANVMH